MSLRAPHRHSAAALLSVFLCIWHRGKRAILDNCRITVHLFVRHDVARPSDHDLLRAGPWSILVRLESLTHSQLSVLVASGAFLLLAPGLFWGVPGGKIIVGGLRVLDGDVPYRDFWSMYAPGQFYLVAALFRTFGTHVIVQGAAALFLIAVAAGAMFTILRARITLSVGKSLLVTAVFVGMEWRLSPELTSYEPFIVCALFAVNFLMRYFAGAGTTQLVWTGVCLGVGAWFKHDVAFYVTTGSAAALILSWIATGPNRPTAWLRPLRAVGVLALAAGAVVLPVVGWFAWKAGPDAWEDLIRFPATDFRIVRGEPYPSIVPPWKALLVWLGAMGSAEKAASAMNQFAVWILANMPQVTFLVTAVWIFTQRHRLAPHITAAGLLFLACMPLPWAAAHVQQNTHFATMATFSLLIGALVWTSIQRNDRGTRARRLLQLAFSVYAVGILLRPVIHASRVPYFWSGSHTTSIPSVRGILLPSRELEAYEPIVSFLLEHVAPTEAIYIGVARHDAIVISNPAFYYLARRRSVSRFHELHPGFADHPVPAGNHQRDRASAGPVRGAVAIWLGHWFAGQDPRPAARSTPAARCTNP